MKRLCFGVLFLAFASIAVRADTMSVFSITAGATGYDGASNGGSTTGTFLSVTSPDGTVSVTASISNVVVSYGLLAVTTSGEALPGPEPIRAISDVTATLGFSDLVTIFGGTGQGQLSYTADITGNFDYLPGKGGSYYLTQINIPTTFTFGTPFEISAQLFARTDAFFFGGEEDASLAITAFTVSDVNGDPLNSYTFADSSETKYNFVNGTYVATPEVSTGILLLAGALVISTGLLLRRS